MATLTALEKKIKVDNKKKEPTYLAINLLKTLVIVTDGFNHEELISLYTYIDKGLLTKLPEEYFESLVKSFNGEGEIKNKLKEFISRYIHKYIEHTYNQTNNWENLEFFYKEFYKNNEHANEYIKKYAKQEDLALLIALSQ